VKVAADFYDGSGRDDARHDPEITACKCSRSYDGRPETLTPPGQHCVTRDEGSLPRRGFTEARSPQRMAVASTTAT